MSGPGDIDGEVSGDEAAWRDLIARFDVPADRTGSSVPWPASEDLPDLSDTSADPAVDAADGGTPPTDHGTRPTDHRTRPTDHGTRPTDHGTRPTDHSARPGDNVRPAKHAADWPTTDAGPSDRPASPPRHGGGRSDRTAGPSQRTARPPEHPADRSDASTFPADPGTDAADNGDVPADGPAAQQGASNPARRPGHPGHPAASPPIPPDRIRIIRPAGDPRSYTPPEEEDEPYVPVPLPPPAKMDSVTKAALVGVIGGPGYLLVVSIFLHWTISAEAALFAIAAFVAGFVTLVVKLGDRSGRDDDDDGAVL